ncbi:hypothetical protein [Cryptosporangium phraense]|uniref:Fis family transcriptional regulator n=1 Tax=Cryptosporangium phraense TaxID=2593070 RepID=A0A545ANN8_9ACTN|nr:hypothetical protein [Cryptosporangium phraense]TQS42893.1 hypothetical protein FL583_22895 [Cryptosporangium phraense]
MDDRWEDLFADAEAQFEALRRDEMASEAADRTRREFALVSLVDRLRGSVGSELEVWLPDASLTGVLARVGPDWMALSAGGAREVVIPLAAVVAVEGLSPATAADPVGPVEARMDLRFVLRRLARDRTPVRLALPGGKSLSGTIDRVGRDFLELAEHSETEPRRARAVRAVRSVPLAALMAVHARVS